MGIDNNPEAETNLLAHSVEERYRNALRSKFPYQDCYKLQRKNLLLTKSLISDLDAYFSFIAGYSSNASNLRSRPTDEIRNAIPKLKRSFFAAYPQYGELAVLVTPDQVAELYAELELADALRSDIVRIMEFILAGGAPA